MKRLFIYLILCVFSIGVHADDEVMYVYLSDGSFRGFYNAEIDSISYSHYDLDSIWHEEMVTQDVWSRDTVERISLCMIDSISYSLPETTYKDNVIILDERYQPYILAHDSLTITFSPNLPDYLRPSVGNVLLYEGSNELFPYGFSGTVTQINGDVVLCDSAALEDVYDRLYFFGTYTLVENDQGSDANGYSLCRITRSSNTAGPSNANRWLWGDDDDDSDWGIFEGSADDIPFDTYKIAEKIEFTSKDIFAAVSGSVTPTASIEFAFIANVYEPLIFYKETDRFDYDAKLQIGFNKDFTPKHPKDFDKPFSVHKVGQEAETEKGLNLYFFNISVPVPQCPVLTIGYKAGLFIDPNLEAEAVLGVDFSMTKEKTHFYRLDKTNIWKNGDWSHFERKPTVTCEPEVEGSLKGSVWAGLMAAINVGVGSDKNGIKEELSAKIGPYIEFELNLDLIDFNSDMSFYSGLKDSKMKRGIKGAISLDFTAKMAKVFNYKWTQMQISPEKLWFEKVDFLLPEFEAPEYYTNGNTLNCSMNLTRCTFANHVGMRIVDESGNEETKWMEDTFKDWTEETPFNFGLSFDNLDFKNHRYTIIPVTRLWFFPTLKIPDPMRTYVTCPDSHHPHLIDMGLPSGVKWLCSNVYADKPADAGGYYQWGNAYKQMSYDESYTLPDIEGSNFQGSSHDAATANIGKEYVTPTADQFEELLSHCSKTIKYSNWVQEEGLFLKASNGADLYLPFSGYMNGKDVESKTKGYFVVSDKSLEDGTVTNPVLKLDGDGISYSSAQWYGYSVRPVSIPSSTGLVLSTNLVNMKVGESATVDITSGSGSYDAVSNAESVATVTVEGSKLVITGVSPGSATITVKDNQTQERAKVEVTVSDGGSTISVTPTKIDFGQVPVGTSRTEHLTVSNVGASDLTFHLSEQHDEIDIPESGTEFTLAAGGEKVFNVVYTPINAGSSSGAAVRVFSDAENGTQYVNISGQGVEGGNTPEDVEAVDLGLPSGLKWANMNVGANSPEDYGDYFAWGEVTPQSDNAYNWESYKWCNGSNRTMTKYCTDLYYGNDGFVDNKTVLDAEDDAAHANWGGDWRMPTHAECQELIDNTTSEWTTQNGVNGYKFTSKTNGKSIFLPAAGYRSNGGLNGAGSNYWSSTLYESYPDGAWCLYFDSGDVYTYGDRRLYGQSVRPVRQGSSLSVSANALSLQVGESATVDITSGSGSYQAVSNAESVATVTVDGSKLVIKGVSPGSATITVKDNQTQERAKVEVTVSDSMQPEGVEAVDLGLPSGLKWANMNVGASSPEDYGDYFAWGEVTPQSDNAYSWESYKWCNGDDQKLTKYCTVSFYGNDDFVDNKTVLDAEDDAAHVNWGGDWRMPTYAECQELFENTTIKWTTQNGVNGRKFTSKTNGNSIFLPAAGLRWSGELSFTGSDGYYWSSTLDESSPRYAWYLYFRSEYVSPFFCYRYRGQSVRPVRQN